MLASDKITAYHAYTEAHEKLFDCTTLEECFETAKNLIKNFRQNRKIASEFAYFSLHRRILGEHPIFAVRKKLDSYRRLGIYQLTLKKQNLEHSIWRIQSEMKKGDKPHLDMAREERLARKRLELETVEEILKSSEKQ